MDRNFPDDNAMRVAILLRKLELEADAMFKTELLKVFKASKCIRLIVHTIGHSHSAVVINKDNPVFVTRMRPRKWAMQV